MLSSESMASIPLNLDKSFKDDGEDLPSYKVPSTKPVSSMDNGRLMIVS